MIVLAAIVGTLDTATKVIQLHLIGAGLLAIIVVSRSIKTARYWRMFVVNAKVVHGLRQRLMEHCLRLHRTASDVLRIEVHWPYFPPLRVASRCGAVV